MSILESLFDSCCSGAYSFGIGKAGGKREQAKSMEEDVGEPFSIFMIVWWS